jgi:hypothetical protein
MQKAPKAIATGASLFDNFIVDLQPAMLPPSTSGSVLLANGRGPITVRPLNSAVRYQTNT